MQVLCQPTDHSADINCPVCGTGFRLFWERTDKLGRAAALPRVVDELRAHHDEGESHPISSFNIPAWSGKPEFSGAALLGGAV